VPPNFLGLKGCREPQKVEKHWSKIKADRESVVAKSRKSVPKVEKMCKR